MNSSSQSPVLLPPFDVATETQNSQKTLPFVLDRRYNIRIGGGFTSFFIKWGENRYSWEQESVFKQYIPGATTFIQAFVPNQHDMEFPVDHVTQLPNSNVRVHWLGYDDPTEENSTPYFRALLAAQRLSGPTRMPGLESPVLLPSFQMASTRQNSFKVSQPCNRVPLILQLRPSGTHGIRCFVKWDQRHYSWEDQHTLVTRLPHMHLPIQDLSSNPPTDVEFPIQDIGPSGIPGVLVVRWLGDPQASFEEATPELQGIMSSRAQSADTRLPTILRHRRKTKNRPTPHRSGRKRKTGPDTSRRVATPRIDEMADGSQDSHSVDTRPADTITSEDEADSLDTSTSGDESDIEIAPEGQPIPTGHAEPPAVGMPGKLATLISAELEDSAIIHPLPVITPEMKTNAVRRWRKRCLSLNGEDSGPARLPVCGVCGEWCESDTSTTVSASGFIDTYRNLLTFGIGEEPGPGGEHLELYWANIAIVSEGISGPAGGESVTVCQRCLRFLQKDKCPTYCLRTFPIGQDRAFNLTMPEKILTSLINNRMRIVKFKTRGAPNGYQSGIKGNVTSFPVGKVSESTMLPLRACVLADYMKIVFLGSGIRADDIIRRIFYVRADVVRRVIEFRRETHPAYRERVLLDEEAMRTLPQNGVPQVLFDTAVIHESELQEESGNYSNLHRHQAEGQGEIPLEETFFTDEKQTAASSTEILLEAIETTRSGAGVPHVDTTQPPLQSARQNNRTTVVTDQNRELNFATTHGRHPSSWFDRRFFPNSLPHLFPFGIGGPSSIYHIRRWARHLMNLASGQFQRDPSFLFLVWSVVQCLSTSRASKTMVKKAYFPHLTRLLNRLSPEDIQVAKAELDKARQPGEPRALSQKSKDVLTVLSYLKAGGASIPGSPLEKKNYRKKIEAMVYRYGLPHLFLTINPSDGYSPLVLLFAGEEIDLANIQSEFAWQQQAILMAKNPAAAARFYHHVITSVLKDLLGFGCGGGVLGNLRSYFGVDETQGRGTLHCHLILWIKGLLNPDELKRKLLDTISDPTFLQRFKNYIGSTIATDLPVSPVPPPVPLPSSSPPVPHRRRHSCAQLVPDPDSISAADKTRDLLEVVKSSNLHFPCTFTCFKYDRNKQNCRFNYPRPLVEETSISVVDDALIVLTKRNNPFINNYNDIISWCTRNNIDIQNLLSGNAVKGSVFYTTDYITKLQMKTHNLLELMVSAIDIFQRYESPGTEHDERGRKMVVKCLNQFCNYQEKPQAEIAKFLLGLDNHYTGDDFSLLFLGDFIMYLGGNNNEYSNFVLDDDNPTLTSQMSDYLHRNPHLENVPLYCYVMFLFKQKGTNGFPYTNAHTQYLTHSATPFIIPHTPVLIGATVPSKLTQPGMFYRLACILFTPLRAELLGSWRLCSPDYKLIFDGLLLQPPPMGQPDFRPMIERIVHNLDLSQQGRAEQKKQNEELARLAKEQYGSDRSTETHNSQQHTGPSFDDVRAHSESSPLLPREVSTKLSTILSGTHRSTFVQGALDVIPKGDAPYSGSGPKPPLPDRYASQHGYESLPPDYQRVQKTTLQAALLPTTSVLETTTPNRTSQNSPGCNTVGDISLKFTLNEEQQRAFFISAMAIMYILGTPLPNVPTIKGLLVVGPAGTGKSRVIDAICFMLVQLGAIDHVAPHHGTHRGRRR